LSFLASRAKTKWIWKVSRWGGIVKEKDGKDGRDGKDGKDEKDERDERDKKDEVDEGGQEGAGDDEV
jgi:hypothetical protein